jgi:hypothetical protein
MPQRPPRQRLSSNDLTDSDRANSRMVDRGLRRARTKLIPAIPFSAELKQMRETIDPSGSVVSLQRACLFASHRY